VGGKSILLCVYNHVTGVLILTEEFSFNLNSCLGGGGEAEIVLCVTHVLQLIIHYAEVQACFACQTIQLFSVVFCVVRHVQKFGFKLVTNEV
jgi:hypothetical protein